MSKKSAIFKVWVVCWPPVVGEEYGDETKPLMPVSVPPEINAYVLVKEKGRKKRRSVAVDPWAVFQTRAEANAWAGAMDYKGHFLIHRATLEVT